MTMGWAGRGDFWGAEAVAEEAGVRPNPRYSRVNDKTEGALMAKAQNPATADADADASAYVRGGMQINEQATTFKLFMDLAKWGSLAVACLLLFLTLWFHPGGSLMAALIGTVVLGVVGFFALKPKADAGH
jgi:Bacterial aa3 type cytochrome c oxidase subunit IV